MMDEVFAMILCGLYVKWGQDWIGTVGCIQHGEW